jgi:sarcosine dehydrogenase
MKLPDRAQIVVIGGGIIGCSTAYHLARDHKADVVLLEQGQLTSGSTWHAAGLVGQLRSSASITKVLKYSVDLYKRLDQETGLETGWKMSGCLRLATNRDRWTEYRRLATTAQSFGMDMHLLSPDEAKAMFPLMQVDDLVGASWLPTDGQASPSDITQSLAKGARMHGARIIENVRVTGFAIENGRIHAVKTDKGDIACEKVVNCGGQWARQIGAMAGINVPLQPVKHQYVITDAIDGLSSDAPTIRDPDSRTYFKEEVGGLSFGGYEPNPQGWTMADVPNDWEFQLFDDDYDHFEQHMLQAMKRVPALEKAGIKQMINGPESFTPDGNFILGSAPNARTCLSARVSTLSGLRRAAAPAGCWPNGSLTAKRRSISGWSTSGGFPRCIATGNGSMTARLEAYGKHYEIGFPHIEYESGRPRIVSPLYDRLKSHRAVFGSKLGWERPNWFAPEGMEPCDIPSMGRQNWFDAVGEEHRHVREKVGIFDQSSFAKYEISGPTPAGRLSNICANDVTKPEGRLTYTQLLNTRGGIEADLTVARLAEDRFYIVTGTGFRTHDLAWIREHVPEGAA